MYLSFRTERDKNGNCKYLAIDTEARIYSRQPARWIDKDMPCLKTKDIRELESKCKMYEFMEVEYL